MTLFSLDCDVFFIISDNVILFTLPSHNHYLPSYPLCRLSVRCVCWACGCVLCVRSVYASFECGLCVQPKSAVLCVRPVCAVCVYGLCVQPVSAVCVSVLCVWSVANCQRLVVSEVECSHGALTRSIVRFHITTTITIAV